jgi:hypothetical protein
MLCCHVNAIDCYHTIGHTVSMPRCLLNVCPPAPSAAARDRCSYGYGLYRISYTERGRFIVGVREPMGQETNLPGTMRPSAETPPQCPKPETHARTSKRRQTPVSTHSRLHTIGRLAFQTDHFDHRHMGLATPAGTRSDWLERPAKAERAFHLHNVTLIGSALSINAALETPPSAGTSVTRHRANAGTPSRPKDPTKTGTSSYPPPRPRRKARGRPNCAPLSPSWLPPPSRRRRR